ncbi:hypothetical protein QTP70_000114 [Hemibagrus guttatus]|uniref:Endonuclease/exonuclease/phosphatase domain-containing protein n=1 Tax=Hemibagrus guttatus TaxID=175788 RepID=A0AAE0R4E8_9TELE|nr:hypothetical protein QTP70_000114 [Hemibagrus guttatus]
MELPGFSTVRRDRDTKVRRKQKGGGLAIYVNTSWCNPGHVTIKISNCCRDIKLLAASLSPYYLPQEFGQAIVLILYIPPRADAEVVCDVIHSTVARLQTQHLEALLLISGDFNHVTLDTTLPAFSQYVDCNRGNRTIDLLYANVKDAYSATSLPALGKAHHNLILLRPHYKPRVRRLPITTCSFRMWSPEAEQTERLLRGHRLECAAGVAQWEHEDHGVGAATPYEAIDLPCPRPSAVCIPGEGGS